MNKTNKTNEIMLRSIKKRRKKKEKLNFLPRSCLSSTDGNFIIAERKAENRAKWIRAN
jgi:hypothetical protein